MTGRTHAARESFAIRWLRRALTLPAYTCGAALGIALLPFWLPVCLLVDVARPRRFARTRGGLALLAYLVAEQVGVLAAGLLFLARPLLRSRARYLAAHYAVQWRWAAAILGAVQLLFGWRVHVEGTTPDPGRPLLVLSRHVSVVDTLFPVVLLGAVGFHPRYILKRELLLDPCLDIVGQRLPNVFVRRGSPNPTAESQRVGLLATALAANDAVVIYPEGTRSTPARRQRALADYAADDPRRALALSLRELLPPRTSGVLALLDRCPDADLLVLGHVGLEGLTRLSDVFHETLVGRSVTLRATLYPRTVVPVNEAERVAWLYRTWQDLDAWVAGQRHHG